MFLSLMIVTQSVLASHALALDTTESVSFQDGRYSIESALSALEGLNRQEVNSSGSASSCEMVIPNGIPTTKFPAVVKLNLIYEDGSDSGCTATLIGDGTLLTAAHCLGCAHGKPDNREVSFEYAGKKIPIARRICLSKYHNDGFPEFSMGFDLALITFDASRIKSPPRYPLLSSRPPKVKDRVTMVGYGKNDAYSLFFDGSGVKRFGTNSIIANEGNLSMMKGYSETPGSSIFDIEGEPTGQNASVAKGDSGGPMFSASGLIHGVAVAGTFLRFHSAVESFEMHHLLISSKEARAFMTAARKEHGVNFRYDDERQPKAGSVRTRTQRK